MISYENLEEMISCYLLISGTVLYEKTPCGGVDQLELYSVEKYKNFCPCIIFNYEELVRHDIGRNLEILVDGFPLI